MPQPSRPGEASGAFQRLDRMQAQPAYPPSETLRRGLWMGIERTLFLASLPHAYGWRRMLLRRFGGDLHPTAALRPGVRIAHPWLLSVGAHSLIASGVVLYNLGPIRIGAHTLISQGAHLCAGTHDYHRSDLPLVRAPITVGNGVWICADAFIMPGVTIGDDCVVGARAVVTRDVPPGSVVAGNPARVVRERSDMPASRA